ncbi:hypothetical protein MRB53_039029 [Persea americana]|nr:hypothetical protein MRB53_039029 [Persea americana]
MQNSNGPCPLLALVNALTLSTPPDLQTALLDTLQQREQVSLGLLLDAVFDELMSGRRGNSAQELPDVSELYTFLVTLHTGMNVNPRFVPDPGNSEDMISFEDDQQIAADTSSNVFAGCFEQTKEMRLYSTFSVPLIHGWLPDEGSAMHDVAKRTAATYEDAQNLQFREEDLRQKESTAGLSFEEEALLTDVAVIKDFLMLWSTQLTAFGLETLQSKVNDGQFCILFRNDHFSTLYKEPKTGALMTLVTDAGYATHDEIVWESLVDINGTQSELFSGDFKSVSHDLGSTALGGSASGEWSAGLESSQHTNPAAAPPVVDAPATTATHARSFSEQEDHDLALALQLQDEEEERARAAQAQRARENQLTEHYLSQESARQGPQIPERRSNANTNTTNTTATTTSNNAGATAQRRTPSGRPEDINDDELAPPPYSPSPANSPAPSTMPQQRQQRSASLYTQQSAMHSNSQLPPRGRRLSSRQNPSYGQASVGSPATPRSGKQQEEEEKCIVM